MQSIERLVASETAAINTTLSGFGVRAGTNPTLAHVIPFSHITYEIRRGEGVPINKVENLIDELSASLSEVRNQEVSVLVKKTPRLCLDVPLPTRSSLDWTNDVLSSIGPHQMVAGKSFNVAEGVRLEVVSFDDESPHYLVCGTTGAGKSVLMQQMIITLAACTSPDDLEIVVVDPKGDDFFEQLKPLPHVRVIVNAKKDIPKAIKYVFDEKERRIRLDRDGKANQKQMVLLVDEINEVGSLGGACLEQLKDIAGIGRSLRINLLVGALRPTREGGVGAFFKDMFPVRFVGRVAAGSSYAATNIKQLYADALPGRGSFLKTGGPEVIRLQSFNLTNDQLERLVGSVCRRWRGASSQPKATPQPESAQPEPSSATDLEAEVRRLQALVARLNSSDRTSDEPRIDFGSGSDQPIRTTDDLGSDLGSTSDRPRIGQNTPENGDFGPLGEETVRPFPLNKWIDYDEFTLAERQLVRQMSNDPANWHNNSLSTERLTIAVYGSACARRREVIKAMLSEVPA